MPVLDVGAWVALLAILWAGGTPVAVRLFPSFPDEGVALGLPMGLVTFGVVTFWVGQVSMAVAPVVALGVVAGVGLVVRGFDARVAARDFRWPVAVFAAAFLLLVAMRFVDPAIEPGGGESFLDFGLLRSLVGTPSLPPEDHWFAGEPVRYYYGGHLLVAALVRLSGVDSAVAFNLGIATAFATLATTVYGVTGALVPDRSQVAGALGVAFAVVGGHLATPVRASLGVLPAWAARSLEPAYVGYRTTPVEGLASARRIATGWYDYWPARHVIPDVPTGFPMWTFVNGDLRPHMVGAGILALGVALCLAFYRTPPTAVRRRRRLSVGGLPVVVGFLVVVNTWGAVTLLGVTWLTLVHASGSPLSVLAGTGSDPDRHDSDTDSDRGAATAPLDELRRGITALAPTCVVAVAGVLVAAPFLLVGPPVSRGIGVVTDPDGVWVLVLAYGGFLATFVLGWVRLGDGRMRSLSARPVGLGLGIAVGLATLLLVDLAPVAVFGPFLVGGWLLLRRRRSRNPSPAGDRTVGFAGLLVVAGAGLALVTSFLYARVWPFDPLAPRWNTVYKVTMHLWVLWGIGAGAVLTRVLGAARKRRSSSAESRPLRTAVTVAVAATILVGVLTFPTFALASHFDETSDHPGPAFTLDARAYVEAERPAVVAAAEWLSQRRGRPTLVDRPGTDPYQWRNLPSTLTGLPTVAGWNHEAGYHGPSSYTDRVADVRRIYTGNRTTACRLLSTYDVEYVYVGPAERDGYRIRNPARLPGVHVAYATANVTVYAVDDQPCRDSGP